MVSSANRNRLRDSFSTVSSFHAWEQQYSRTNTSRDVRDASALAKAAGSPRRLFHLAHHAVRRCRSAGDDYRVTFGACLRWVRTVLRAPDDGLLQDAAFLARAIGRPLDECLVLRALAPSMGRVLRLIEADGRDPLSTLWRSSEPCTFLACRGRRIGPAPAEGGFELLGEAG